MTFDRISGGRVQIVCRVDEAGIPVCVCVWWGGAVYRSQRPDNMWLK